MKTKLISAASKMVAPEDSTVGVSVGLIWVASASIVGIRAMVGKAVAWAEGWRWCRRPLERPIGARQLRLQSCSTLKRSTVIRNRPRQKASTLLNYQLTYLQ